MTSRWHFLQGWLGFVLACVLVGIATWMGGQ